MDKPEGVRRILTEFEKQVDLYAPEGGPFGCRILDYGEVTVVIALDAVPGKALKRMSGFISEAEALEYVEEEKRYYGLLSERGITPLPTECVVVTAKTPVVYLVQDLVKKKRLGNSIIRDEPMETVAGCIEAALDRIASSVRYNRQIRDGLEAVADSQLSNWYFPETGGPPFLIDVGSPITRVNGKVYAFTQLFYRSFPWPLSSFVKWLGAVESYFNEYFDLRLAILDMLGNFYKEQASARVAPCIEVVNGWLDRQPEKDGIKPITLTEVKKYYGKDAALLELMFQVRRYTRFIRNRIFRGRYDYILPGHIKRL
ncbi:MAG: hypothetical protein EHM32_11340 [Spirochaetales bacterium]|nr:MAG: hypothetical protein EHM32_11340 [Spirochaetales bacterium]